MKRFAIIALGIVATCAVAVLILMCLPVRGPDRLIGGALTDAPDGYVAMCRAQRDLCATPPASDGVLTAYQTGLLDTVNAEVNYRVIQRPDGSVDLWQVATTEGDCEDIALAKRQALIQRGFPANRLALAVAWLPEDDRHVVLIARLDDGDVILDNQFNSLLPVSKVGWRWISIQSVVAPLAWFEVAA